MEKNLLKDLFLKRRSTMNLNQSNVSTTTTINGYETAAESFSDSLYYSINNDTLENRNVTSEADSNLTMPEKDVLTAKKKKNSIESISPVRHQQSETAVMMLQSTPQILNKSTNIREEIPDIADIVEDSLSSNSFENEKSTIVDGKNTTDVNAKLAIDENSLKVLEKSVTMFRGEYESPETSGKENSEPDFDVECNIAVDFNVKSDEEVEQSLESQKPKPVPRKSILAPKNSIKKPVPSPRQTVSGAIKKPAIPIRSSRSSVLAVQSKIALCKNTAEWKPSLLSNLSSISEKRETSVNISDEEKPTAGAVSKVMSDLKLLVDKNITNTVTVASVAATSKSTRISISSRFRKSFMPSLSTEDTNVPAKKNRKSLLPQADNKKAVVPSTRIRKSILPVTTKSPIKKRQSIAVTVKAKTTGNAVAEPMKRRSAGRKSIAHPNNRKSIMPQTSTQQSSIAAEPMKRRSAGRKSIMPPTTTTRQTVMQDAASRRTVMPSSLSRKPIDPPSTSTAVASKADLTCDVCNKVFRLKSNLTAHKRLHGSSAGGTFKCKFCDKAFALKTAFDNHMIEYCTKIPMNEKKKLLYQTSAVKSRSTDNETSINMSTISNKSVAGNSMQAPKSSVKQPKQRAHTGIDRTPTKVIDCRIGGCKKKFTDVLSYTNHAQTHSSSSSSGDEK